MKKTLFILIFALGLVGLGLKLAMSPLRYGMPEDAFSPGPRDTAVVADLVEPLASDKFSGIKRRPNIVIIFADDLGWGDIGVQGSVAIETPNIDQLASDGVRLTDFYASAPLCSPSRAGLLTGRYPLRSGFANVLAAADDTAIRKLMVSAATGFSKLGMTDMAGGPSPVKGLPESEITLPEALRVQGYRTLGVGKWHLGDFTHFPEFHPSNQGFEHFFGYNMSNDDWPVALWRDHRELIKDIGIKQQSHTREFTEEAVKFIHQWRDQPYFIYLAHKDPHQPFYPSEKFAGKSAGGPYGDAVSEFDWSVGQVVQALRDSGQLENTLLILTSDNGPWFEGSTGGLRGRKGQSYEGGFRVPFIAAWPGHIPAGVVSHSPAMNIDIFPTALAVAGLATPSDRVIDGENLMPLLLGEKAATEQAENRSLYFFHEFDVEAVRRGRWKYITSNSHYVWPIPLDKNDLVSGQAANGRDYYPPGSDVGIPTLGTWPLLYDLSIDPSESYNLAKGHPEITQTMGDSISAWHAEFMANPRGWK